MLGGATVPGGTLAETTTRLQGAIQSMRPWY
jgi:hypothetical protein